MFVNRREKLKRYSKNLLVLSIALILIFGISSNAYASTYYGTKTKTVDAVNISLSYTSYIDSLGRKLVTGGIISSISGMNDNYLYSEISRSLSLIDGGRTYSVSTYGETYYCTMFDVKYLSTKTRYAEFSYTTIY